MLRARRVVGGRVFRGRCTVEISGQCLKWVILSVRLVRSSTHVRSTPNSDRLAGVRCIAALSRVKSLQRHRSDRPKRRLTTDQMTFVAGRHVA